MANNKQIKSHSKKAGLPPGTLIHVGEKKSERVRITLLDYNEEGYQERVVENIEECFPSKDTPTVSWINIDGLHETEIIEKIGSHFDIHHLILEDILNTAQRPKCEDYGSRLYIVLNMLRYDDRKNSVKTEQVSLVLGKNFVVSFQEEVGDVFEQIRDRIRNGKGKIRKMDTDYLAYSLIDAIVDSYFLILEKMGDQIESIEEELLVSPSEIIGRKIHSLKRELIFLRKSVWPLRELINKMDKEKSVLVSDSTLPYLRDVYDHAIQIMDSIESYRDIVSGMLDSYLSSLSNRMNAVMKVLTIIATIFIPLTFIAGIYGMNFRYMPELEWRSGYFIVLGIMAAVAIGMLIFFKRKKWL